MLSEILATECEPEQTGHPCRGGSVGGWLPKSLLLQGEGLAHVHVLLRPPQKEFWKLRNELIKCPKSRIDAHHRIIEP